MNVLIVDDSKTDAFIVARMLREANHEVMIARDAPEALALLAEYPIQILLIDWVLPTMDGPELVQQIREKFTEPYRYVIMVTAKSGHEYLIRGLRSGVDDYMEKPVNAAELEARMKIGERIVNLELDLKQNLREINRVREEWEATINAIPQLICLVDYMGKLIHANQVIKDWQLAYDRTFVGLPIYDLLRPAYPDFAAYIEKNWPMIQRRLFDGYAFDCEVGDESVGCYFYAQFQPVKQIDDAPVADTGRAFAAINIQDITERKLLELKIREANQRSEILLLNILPEPIAERLKRGETNIAESFDNVTVLFADLVEFIRLTATTPPVEFIDLLNGIFSTFDYLSQQYGLEKIKTIGDSYMVVAGVPVPHDNHACAVANMALDMLSELQSINEISGHDLELRIGIDSGAVIAGVIGTQKFIYDLWGDTVNTASRMTSSSIPGRIQVTQTTYDLLKDTHRMEKRGEVDVKGKGPMVTYWLLGKN